MSRPAGADARIGWGRRGRCGPAAEPCDTAIPASRDAASRDAAFFVTIGVVFLATAAATLHLCGSMADGMPMPGGWTMSMAWMRMPGQSWPGAAAAFIGSWFVMMIAMMLPSLVPPLYDYRRAARAASGATTLARTTILVGVGYFCLWGVVGAAAYALGLSAATAEMRWPALSRLVPGSTGVVVIIAALVQLTPWKARQLGCCRRPLLTAPLPANGRGAWRHGVGLGVRCASCCAGFTTILIAAGVMDLTVMALVAAAITFERLAPWPVAAARMAGIAALATGAVLLGQALIAG
jgi:predicted metal-binding membrane protein